ncbi:Adenylate kinase isoenzyme 6 [Babesia bovis T2Bo]|uniref:Adenylate kinase isoenzyme 6 homolog n=1 Tax=Babesia bovis TaxID=5865 RepID=A7AUU0_BABBO|nr:Adenylate kinase isoenzyme 6 [Babesia bovis T2Bo]EDO06701.1 Adenylate kinase isoenzyme 6 [Babesia bovis T2Bo]|eukprot:XP_001610269.1 hypothetical protein [Babesia bovis T2Bo]
MRERGCNILVTGTPGVGKTRLCNHVASELGLTYVNVAELIRDEQLHSGWDSELDCSIYDERKLRKALKQRELSRGGFILEFHSVDGIREGDIDHVLVLSAEIEILSKRLSDRGYGDKKIDCNIEAEIFKVCLQDAVDHFGEDKVVELPSNTESDFLGAVEHVRTLVNMATLR